jgi:hypothetical protein
MPLLPTTDNSPPAWDFVYDEVLLEMAAAHPELSELNETTIKTRLLEIMAAADASACDDTDLMHLFREALDNVGKLRAGKLRNASPNSD